MLPQRHHPIDFAELTDIELALLEEFSAQMPVSTWSGLSEAKMKIVAAIVLNADSVALMKLSERYPAINELCLQPVFNEHWNELLKACGNNPDNKFRDVNRPIHEFLPLKTVPSFQLLKSIYVYGIYKRLNKSEEKEDQLRAEEYLLFAAELGNFNAMNGWCSERLEASDWAEKTRSIIVMAQTAADLYLAPGYILLANVYVALAKRSTNQNKKMYVALALRALCVAEKLESISGNMINNAYHGKSILEAAAHEFSSWQDARQKIMQLSDHSFTIREIDGIFRNANQTAASVINPNSVTALRKSSELSQSSSPVSSPRRNH